MTLTDWLLLIACVLFLITAVLSAISVYLLCTAPLSDDEHALYKECISRDSISTKHFDTHNNETKTH